MNRLSIYEKGDVARFKASFKDENGNVIEPDVLNGTHDVSIMVKHIATDDIVVSDTQMQEISNTQFRYDWQTTEGTKKGEYSVVVSGGFNKDENRNRDRFKVVDILDPNIGQ